MRILHIKYTIGEKHMKDILERLKTDKDYRFDFIIAVWSGIIIIAVVIALICGIMFVSGKVNKEPEPAATNAPTEEPSKEPSPTPFEEEEEDGETDAADEEEDITEGEEADNDINGSNDTVYATTTVNVRADATTDSASLGKITAGTSVERTESMANGWSKVIFKGQTAYIKSEFLSSSPVSAATKAPLTTKAPATNTKPSANKAPAVSAKKTAKPKATKAPVTEEDDEDNDDKDKDSSDNNSANPTDTPVKTEPTSVPPVSDNFTGTESVNTQENTMQTQ